MAVQDLIITSWQNKGFDQFLGNLTKGERYMGSLEKKIDQTQGKLSSLGKGANFSIAGGAAAVGLFGLIGKASIDAAAQVQTTKAGYESLLGSAAKANELYSQIQKYSLGSSLDNAETAKSAQLLLATGTAMDQIIPRIKAIDNASSTAGGGQARFNGILQALTKIGLMSKVSFMQLKQISLRGVDAVKILEQELGLTADQVTNISKSGIKGAEVVDALIRGFSKLSGGKAVSNLNKTFTGQISQMKDATDQLEAQLGTLAIPRLTPLITDVANLTQSVNTFSRAHPRLLGGLEGAAALVGGGLVAGAAYNKATTAASGLNNMYKLLSGSRNRATKAAKALAVATDVDSLAEKGKALVAGKEGDAIHYSATAAERAIAAKAELQMATEDAAAAAGVATKKMTLLGRAQALLGKGVGPQFGGGQFGAGPFGLQGATVGSAAIGATLGVGAGLGARDDYHSNVAGITVGLTAAALAAFNPAAAALIAAAEVIRNQVDTKINRPLEDAALKGNGLSPEVTKDFAKQSNQQKAKDYEDLAKRLQKDAVENGPGVDDLRRKINPTSSLDLIKNGFDSLTGNDPVSDFNGRQAAIKTAQLQANRYRKLATAGPDQGAADSAFLAKYGPKDDPGSRKGLADYEARGGYVPAVETKILNDAPRRDGSRTYKIEHTVTMAQGPGDNLAKNANFNRLTPRR